MRILRACLCVPVLLSLLSACAAVRETPSGEYYSMDFARHSALERHISIGRTTQDEVLKSFGPPTFVTKDLAGNDMFEYFSHVGRITIAFKEGVVWSSRVESYIDDGEGRRE